MPARAAVAAARVAARVLALAGLHLRQPALQHHPGPHHLLVVMALADGARSHFPDQGKGPDAQDFLQSPGVQATFRLDHQVVKLPTVQGG